MKLSYKTQRNLAFWTLFLTGTNYFVLLAIAAQRIFSGGVMQIIFLGELFRGSSPELSFILSRNFLIYLAGGVFLTSLIWKLVRGLFKTIGHLLKTHQTLQTLNILETSKEYYVFASKNAIAFTAGLFRPKIYFSSQLSRSLTGKGHEAVLLHEKEHQANLDPLKDFIVTTLKLTTPNFPGKSKLLEKYATLVEITCDAFAGEKMGSNRPIMEALLKIFDFNPTYNLFYTSFFSKESERIKILSGQAKLNSRGFFVSNILLFTFILFSLIMIPQVGFLSGCSHPHECLKVFMKGSTHITVATEIEKECTNHSLWSTATLNP